MPHAKAFLGNNQVKHVFKFNPDSVDWGYRLNVRSQPTLGGRVIQLLSVNVEDMTFQGVAGSRSELQRFAISILKIMKWSINHQHPVELRVPSRKWRFMVYPSQLPRLGWDETTVTYPFQMQLKIEEDLGIKTRQILRKEIQHIAKGIGYSEDWHGGNPAAAQQIISTIMSSASGGTSGTGGSGDVGTGGGSGITPGSVSQFDKVYPAHSHPLSFEDTIRIMLSVGLNQQQAVIRTAIATAESGRNPHGPDSSTGDHGIMQINGPAHPTIGPSTWYNPVKAIQTTKNWALTNWCTYCSDNSCHCCCGGAGSSGAAYHSHLAEAQRALQNVLNSKGSGGGKSSGSGSQSGSGGGPRPVR